MAASDFQINSRVRSLLARHWIDLKRVQVGSFRGTVRLAGELCRLGGESAGRHEPQLVETLDQEIRAIPDVERVHFEITNWKRTGTGQWVCTDARASGKATTSTGSGETMSLIMEGKPGGGSQPAGAERPGGGAS